MGCRFWVMAQIVSVSKPEVLKLEAAEPAEAEEEVVVVVESMVVSSTKA